MRVSPDFHRTFCDGSANGGLSRADVDCVTEAEGCTSDDSLSQAAAGDSAAFTALVCKHQRSVYSLALRMLSDRHDAEDLAQDVFLQLHRSVATIESDAHLSFWLRKVTINRAIDRLRREPRHVEATFEDALNLISETSDDDPMLQRRLRELIGRLPPAPRAVILLRYQEDLDPTEIARTLSMSINTVKSHLKRSLSILREQVGDTAAMDSRAANPSKLDPSYPKRGSVT
jgi:RNA polymerase sigma-70 factor (ECF subfamily)